MKTMLMLACVALAGAARAEVRPLPPVIPIPTGDVAIAKGPFTADWDSLKTWQCPEWFRDAKFGIWAHWGPQAVPMAGDWYAKHMYVQGHRQNAVHLEKYGHPSEVGYKDVIPLWKAEKWDPEHLMDLYQKAGAKYFVSMGVHHDNFDLWNSKYHRWNAVLMGPQRDIVGEWKKAAEKRGLRFGVSEHLGASFTWFQTSRGADKTGPKAGVPYDGTNPLYEDLYHPAAAPDDRAWYSTNPAWHNEWFLRIRDLVDRYQPDLLYTDGGVPFGEVGRRQIANLYNGSASRHGGRNEAVYTCKKIGSGEFVDGTCVQDMERGGMPGINPLPWQTDTSIADWFYNTNWKTRKTDWVVRTLVDIVSKNGNLLLNVTLRPDGALDPEVEQLLVELAAWMKVHGEAIFATRPWLTYGEGPTKVSGGHFKEDFAFSGRDIRFTTKGDKTLYAIALGWPKPEGGKLVIRSLAKPAAGDENRIEAVTLLGYDGKLEWTQTAAGLEIVLPATPTSELACAFKITGANFKPAPLPAEPVSVVVPDGQGRLILTPAEAELHGALQVEEKGARANIGFWDNGQDWVSWKVSFAQAGTYRVHADCAATQGGGELQIEVAGQTLAAAVPSTGSWTEYKGVALGPVEIAAPGEQVVKVRPKDPKVWKAVNLRAIRFVAK